LTARVRLPNIGCYRPLHGTESRVRVYVIGSSRRGRDEAVIARSLKDPDCFRELFRRHRDRIHSYVSRRVGRAEAEDLAADIWLAAFAKRSSFDSSRGTVVGWLYGIAHNVTATHQRRSRAYAALAGLASTREAHVTHDDPFQRAVEGVDATAAMPVVLKAMRLLSKSDRELLELYVWEGLTYPDIAQILNIPVGTVRSRISRARARLAANVEARGMSR